MLRRADRAKLPASQPAFQNCLSEAIIMYSPALLQQLLHQGSQGALQPAASLKNHFT